MWVTPMLLCQQRVVAGEFEHNIYLPHLLSIHQSTAKTTNLKLPLSLSHSHLLYYIVPYTGRWMHVVVPYAYKWKLRKEHLSHQVGIENNNKTRRILLVKSRYGNALL